MKLRHVATLALVGWYLMLPPFDDDPDIPTKPLSVWHSSGAYDSAAACETAKEDIERKTANFSLSHPNSKSADRDASRWSNAQCIASDDPRLKGN
jgi:hypothetical protein